MSPSRNNEKGGEEEGRRVCEGTGSFDRFHFGAVTVWSVRAARGFSARSRTNKDDIADDPGSRVHRRSFQTRDRWRRERFSQERHRSAGYVLQGFHFNEEGEGAMDRLDENSTGREGDGVGNWTRPERFRV